MSDEAQGVIPHLIIDGAADALDFYKKALGATEVMRLPAEDGKRLLHAEMRLNGSRVYLTDCCPERGSEYAERINAPNQLGGTAVVMHLDVPDCDRAVERAVEAGAKVLMAPWDAFWGARYAQIIDPFGHVWSFAHPLQPRQE